MFTPRTRRTCLIPRREVRVLLGPDRTGHAVAPPCTVPNQRAPNRAPERGDSECIRQRWRRCSPSADLPTVISNATGWLVGILAALATFFLTLGGIRYMAADGNPGEVERAKGALRSAGIGYALAILAPVVLTVLKKILGI